MNKSLAYFSDHQYPSSQTGHEMVKKKKCCKKGKEKEKKKDRRFE